jgi:hypothetical protein
MTALSQNDARNAEQQEEIEQEAGKWGSYAIKKEGAAFQPFPPSG